MSRLGSVIFNKVPSFTLFGLKKLLIAFGDLFLHESVHGMIFNSYFVTPNVLIF